MLSKLIQALKEPSIYPHPVDHISLVETHISWIILTGLTAYKIKKPVDFGFLDFTTLAKRKQYCEAELTLNSRAAPDLYQEVVAIYGSEDKPSFQPNEKSADEPIEYAVKMTQFELGLLFTQLQERGELSFQHIDDLAEHIAEFHEQVSVAEPGSYFGRPDQVFAPMQQNFDQIRDLLADLVGEIPPDMRMQLDQIEAWTQSTFNCLEDLILRRQQQGKVRECHGDMHMGNLTLFQGKVTLFDCIEFNDDFRWIDVISDVAFLVMDFEDKGLKQFANRFISEYLEHTGDYSGLRLLAFYKAYRAVVRAKVALLTILSRPDEKDSLVASYTSYMELAESCSGLPNRVILTMHGVSGTGKSTVAQRLVDQLGAIRIRSDRERKRLYGIDEHEHPDAEQAKQVYSDKANHETYEEVARLCIEVLDSGLSVIVDATNLMRWQRDIVQSVGDSRGVPVCIGDCQVEMDVIRGWIEKRAREDDDVSDADLSVLDHQLENLDPFTEEELKQTFVIHSDIQRETNEFVSHIKKRFL